MARSNSKLNWTWSWQFNQALRYSFRNGDVRERSWTKQVKWYDGDWREYYLPCRSYRVACPRDLCNQQGKRHWSMNGYGYFIFTRYLIRRVHGVIFYLWMAPVSDPNWDGYETVIFFQPDGYPIFYHRYNSMLRTSKNVFIYYINYDLFWLLNLNFATWLSQIFIEY
jgi:hypothetical protein